MSEKTIFQKIIDREIPGDIVYEDEQCIAINDVNPQAPVHVLIIPKKLIERVGQANLEDQALLGHLLLKAQVVAQRMDCATGFRLVVNNGLSAGETVPHLHIHLLGGRKMVWPPG